MGKLTGEILQRIYDSEIHLRLGWLWDGGLDYTIGTDSPDLWGTMNKRKIVHTGAEDIADGISVMADDIALLYPFSPFAKWWREKVWK